MICVAVDCAVLDIKIRSPHDLCYDCMVGIIVRHKFYLHLNVVIWLHMKIVLLIGRVVYT